MDLGCHQTHFTLYDDRLVLVYIDNQTTSIFACRTLEVARDLPRHAFSIVKLPFADTLSYVNAVRQHSRTHPYFTSPRVFKSSSAVDGQGT